MKNIAIFLLAYLVTGCANYFTYVSYNNNNLRPPAHHTITIDDQYDFYIRKVYTKETAATGKYLVSNLRLSDDNDSLVEIEYLLVSSKKNTTIYLTMIQDKRQSFYRQHYLGDGYLNAFDFRNFLFGTFKNDTAFFQSKKDTTSTEEWTLHFNRSRDTVFVQTIIETKHGEFEQALPVDRTLEKGIAFITMPQPQIVFHQPKYPNTENIIPVDNKFFFYKKGRKERLQVHLLQKVKNYSIIYFKGRRIPYRANSLYDQP